MDGTIAVRVKPVHLICGTGWAVLLTIGCGYFAYRTLGEIRVQDYDWYHNWWDAVTWAVWAVFAAGLISETRCWRERLVFGILLVQFLLGCVFSLWASAPFTLVHDARWICLVLWSTATLMGFVARFFRS